MSRGGNFLAVTLNTVTSMPQFLDDSICRSLESGGREILDGSSGSKLNSWMRFGGKLARTSRPDRPLSHLFSYRFSRCYFTS